MKNRHLLLGALLVFTAVASLAPHAAAECHYWSYEACMDSCERGAQNGTMNADEFSACSRLCSESCGGGGGSGDDNDTGGDSPIVIDLGRGTFRFTSAADGVLFDIDADGRRDPISWTDPASEDGFLALDRDGNGTIDSGRELFGNYTPQPASPSPNGFRALAVFDATGDGAITADDPVFGELRLWIDVNHNGRSEAGELATLETFGIVSIDLHYVSSRRRDPHGNELRYRSRVERTGPPAAAVDVFFRELR